MNNKAIAYCRCSTDMQEASIPEQKKSIEEYAKKNGLTILKYFEDEGFSGRNAEDRPAFMAMVNYIESCRDFKFLLVYDESRFGRLKDPEEATYWEVRFRKSGKMTKYVTGKSSNDNTLGGRIEKHLKHEQATQYSLDLSKTSFRGHRHYAELGYHVGGSAKYGYKRLLVDESGKPVKVLEYGEHKGLKTQHTRLVKGDPDEVRTVQRIFDLYVNKGNGTSTITNILNKEGVQPPKRRPRTMSKGWSKSTIWYLLHDPTYCGHIVYNKKKYDNLCEQDKEWGTHKPESEWVVCKNAHDAIIDEETYSKVLAKTIQAFKGNYKFKGKGNGYYSPYLLTGLIKCLNCNGVYQGRRSAHYSKKKEYKTEYYVCGSYVMKGKHICASWCIPKEILETFAIERMKKTANDPVRVNRIKDEVNKLLQSVSKASDNGVEGIDKELSELRTQKSKWMNAIEKGLDESIAIERLNEIRDCCEMH